MPRCFEVTDGLERMAMHCSHHLPRLLYFLIAKAVFRETLQSPPETDMTQAKNPFHPTLTCHWPVPLLTKQRFKSNLFIA